MRSSCAGLKVKADGLLDRVMFPNPVLFFLFLDRFSETFISNILRDSKKNASSTMLRNSRRRSK
jgi:hypothetical protein